MESEEVINYKFFKLFLVARLGAMMLVLVLQIETGKHYVLLDVRPAVQVVLKVTQDA